MPAVPRPTGRGTAAIAAALALLAALPYLGHGGLGAFVNIDDSIAIVENPMVRAGLSAAGFRWAFTTFHTGNWHPLTWISHMLDVTLFGLDARGHHLTSFLIHALNTALLFLALARLTGRRWPSALVAALFGAHPLHVESVAWVAERKDVLAGLLFMLVLLSWERFVRRGGAGRLGLATALLLLGLMAKPMLVTVPFVLLLLDFWPLGRLRFPPRAAPGARPLSRLLVEKLPLLVLAAASSALTTVAQRAGGTLADLQALSPGLRIANAIISYARYLGLTLWPSGLCAYYPHPLAGVSWAQAGGGLGLLIGLTLAAARQAGTRPYLAVGWCWFVGMLVPVIGLVQVGAQAMADRYTYLPLIGVFLAFAWLMLEVARTRGAGAAARAAAIAAVAACAISSAAQVGSWVSSETLFRRALAVTEDNWLAYNNLGDALQKRGAYAEALLNFQEAHRIRPGFAPAVRNIGVALLELGRVPEATEWIRRAIFLEPGDPGSHMSLGVALKTLGQTREAEASFREAIRRRPDFAEALLNLGLSLSAQGRLAEAEASYREALRIRPGYAEVHTNLGVVLARSGRSAEAEACFREALKNDPFLFAAHVNLGRLLAARGESAQAEESFRAARRIRPGSPDVPR